MNSFQLPLDQPQMFLTRSFYPAPVNFVNTQTDPPSRVHSQLCENVPEEACTLMEEEEEEEEEERKGNNPCNGGAMKNSQDCGTIIPYK
jgi:hypothetical protein